MRREQCVWIAPTGERVSLMNTWMYEVADASSNVVIRITSVSGLVRDFDCLIAFRSTESLEEHLERGTQEANGTHIAELDRLMGVPQNEEPDDVVGSDSERRRTHVGGNGSD